MLIKVKSVKVIKTGTGEFGEWKMVGVTTAEGVKYVTFAKDAESIIEGTTLNISEMDENEKGKSFKKFEFVEGTSAKDKVVAGPVPPSGSQISLKSDRDSSMEAQAFRGFIELWASGIELPDQIKLVVTRWGLTKLGVKELPASLKAPEKPAPKETVEDALASGVLLVVEGQDTTEIVRPEGMPAHIKTGANLAAFAGKHGIDLTKFVSLVQSSPNNVKSESQLIAAWNVLLPEMQKAGVK